MKRKYISLLALSLVAVTTSCNQTPSTPEDDSNNPEAPITPIAINDVLAELRKGFRTTGSFEITESYFTDNNYQVPDEKLESKKVKLYTDIIGPLVFMIFAATVLLLMPSQIILLDESQINPRTFPVLLMGLILICSAVQLIKEIVRIVKKNDPAVKEINLLVEVKALIILVILIGYAVLMQVIGFTISSVLAGVAMLLFFRIKKPLYYAIIIFAAVLIGVFFRSVLNVPLP